MKPKFKVIELDWYCSFTKYLHGHDLTDQQAYELCLELFLNEKNDFYDGPFRYIEECNDPGFPPRSGVKYCVRTSKKCIDGHYKPYECYCYQVGRWWKYKEEQQLFTDVYVPQIMSHYDYSNYNSSLKFLSKDAYNDWIFHQRKHELRAIRRNARQFTAKYLKRS